MMALFDRPASVAGVFALGVPLEGQSIGAVTSERRKAR
jgi:hypothetical protein